MTPAVFDIIVAVIILISAGVAWRRGLIREIFTIVGLGLAALGTYKGGVLLIPYMNKWMNVSEDGGETAALVVSESTGADAASNAMMKAAAHKSELIMGIMSPGMAAKIAAYGTVFIVLFIFFALMSYFLSRAVHESGMTSVDKFAGAVFGVARGFALIFLPYATWLMLAGGLNADGDYNGNMPLWATNSTSGKIMKSAYAYTDTKMELSKYVQKKGDKIGIEIDTSESPEADVDAEAELQEALDREEAKHQAEEE